MSWRFCRSTQRLRRIGAVESIKARSVIFIPTHNWCVIVVLIESATVVTETLRSDAETVVFRLLTE